MTKRIGKTHLAIALTQAAIFNLGLMFGQTFGPPEQSETTIVQAAAFGETVKTDKFRRPPRWPGRSKGLQGLAIIEASGRAVQARMI